MNGSDLNTNNQIASQGSSAQIRTVAGREQEGELTLVMLINDKGEEGRASAMARGIAGTRPTKVVGRQPCLCQKSAKTVGNFSANYKKGTYIVQSGPETLRTRNHQMRSSVNRREQVAKTYQSTTYWILCSKTSRRLTSCWESEISDNQNYQTFFLKKKKEHKPV